MTGTIDAIHFQDLAREAPSDVCRRALCAYDSHSGGYTVSIWGEQYGVEPDACRIVRLRDNMPEKDVFLTLFMVHYLLTAKDIPIQKEWVSEKDIPGGVGFFQGPHAIPAYLIRKRYGADLGGFCERCAHLSGSRMDMADAAYAFRIAPRIPVAVLLWKGDDEFRAESKLLFDRSIGEHLALDIIFALAVVVCGRLTADTRDRP